MTETGNAAAQYELPFVALTPDPASQGRPEREPPQPAPPPAPLPIVEPQRAAPSAVEDLETLPTTRRERTHGKAKARVQPTIAPDAKLLVSRDLAAEMLSISVRGIDYMIATKRLPTRRIANRVLIPISEVRKFAHSDHPEPMAGTLRKAKVISPDQEDALDRATERPADAARPLGHPRNPPPAETVSADPRLRKPSRAATCAEPSTQSQESAGGR